MDNIISNDLHDGVTKTTVAIYGDMHFLAKHYGGHNDYPSESLAMYKEVVDIVEKREADYAVCCGDLELGRIGSLEYRLKLESLFNRVNKITDNKHYCVKGNHDSASYGMTEYEYYEQKGMFHHEDAFDVGRVHFSLIDYSKDFSNERNNKINIQMGDNDVNIVVDHNYLKFKDTKLPNFGTALEIDDVENLYGADIIICGHIHKIMTFGGRITKDGVSREVSVTYPGCPTRPSYSSELDTKGRVLIFDIFSDGRVNYDVEEFDLPSIEESFNLIKYEEAAEKKEEKENRLDITDIVKTLNEHERVVGNPEDIIMGLVEVPEIYRNKAVELLHIANK